MAGDLCRCVHYGGLELLRQPMSGARLYLPYLIGIIFLDAALWMAAIRMRARPAPGPHDARLCFSSKRLISEKAGGQSGYAGLAVFFSRGSPLEMSGRENLRIFADVSRLVASYLVSSLVLPLPFSLLYDPPHL